MDRNGQLTFSDDPLLPRLNEAYRLIEDGSFHEAVAIFDELMDANPDYPGVPEGYRVARFWNNRAVEMTQEAEGKKKADYLMRQWKDFSKYAGEKQIADSAAARAAMKYIFQIASRQYRIAFQRGEGAADNFELLLNLGYCLVTLGDHKNVIDTLEYARSSYRASARLLAILGESYFHTGDVPKSLLYFREAFFLDPSEIDLSIVKAKPVTDLLQTVRTERPGCADPREWAPVYGYLQDVFYVRRQLGSHQIESIKKDIYTLETNFQTLSRDRIENSNITPRLINKYLWMLDYFEYQNYDFQSVTEIRQRLVAIDKRLFEEHFKREKKK
ncbi:MAG TPA: hypothetical protein PKM65_05385 [Spirochaetota bacterium]|nr:hypothetical protein [Spirochaetota bacterium]HNT10214.1 hypothetical protein [Spirochaetota bacterium]